MKRLPDHRTAVDEFLEASRSDFVVLGQKYFEVFEYDRKRDKASTQVRNLQQVTCSAQRFSDIEDFVKNQMGKEKAGSPKWRSVGGDTLKQLAEIRTKAEQIAQSNADGEDTKQQALTIRLLIARSWMRTVVSEYLYQKALDSMPKVTDGD